MEVVHQVPGEARVDAEASEAMEAQMEAIQVVIEEGAMAGQATMADGTVAEVLPVA
jgi:hypothetical protein